MLSESINNLYYLFNNFNKKFYDGELQVPIISIQSTSRRNVLGWCTTSKVWKNKNDKSCFYEINMCAEYMNRDLDNLSGTLLHEMVHLYHLQNGIKGVSRGNTYHNKRFKEDCESHGLEVEYDSKIGWSVTSLSNDTKEYLENIIFDQEFNYYRNTYEPEPEDEDNSDEDGSDDENGEKTIKKPKQSSKKHICPNCGNIARTTKIFKLVCGDCDIEMTIDE